jgi:DeoR/GlpR family transcriptional regulator of sugar metabolism
LLPVERRRQIAKLAEESDVLRIGELASRFEVADETIRRDFVWLEQQGVLSREHGGALSTGADRESLYNSREREHSREKRLIAQLAVDFVNDSSTIILDSGTTIHHLVALLRSKRDLVVITNGISHVAGLLANPTTSVVVAGGSVRRESIGTVGDLAVATLEKLHADHTFLATHGFSAQMGITYPNLEEVAVKRAMIAAGSEVTLLADGSKYGRVSMAQVASLAEVDRVITSGPIPEEEIARMRDLGLEVIVADEDIEPGLKLRRIVP